MQSWARGITRQVWRVLSPTRIRLHSPYPRTTASYFSSGTLLIRLWTSSLPVAGVSLCPWGRNSRSTRFFERAAQNCSSRVAISQAMTLRNMLIPLGRPANRLSQNLLVAGVLVSEVVVPGLHINDPGGLVGFGPADDVIAFGLFGCEQRMNVSRHVEEVVNLVVNFKIGDPARDRMIRVGDVDLEMHVMFVCGSGFDHAVDVCLLEVVVRAEDLRILRPFLVRGDRMVQHHQPLSILEPGYKIRFGLLGDFLVHVVRDKHVPGFSRFGFEQRVSVGMFHG